MRTPIIAGAAALCLSLGACQTTGGGTSPLPANISQIIAQARVIAEQVCGFLPVADDVAQIILAADPTYATASTIANAICRPILNNRGLRRGVGVSIVTVRVGGQPILVHRAN
jgi:hypothetical protein